MDLPRLRRVRQGAVMSQEELAERSGVARDTISKLETGRRGAYPSTIRKLAAGGVEYLEDPSEVETPENELPNKPGRDRKVGF
jgi:transcriptional regulator with XRE-family HTH domain